MRKGMVHVDWVISFGIFVVFLLMMFIWFGPALARDYDDDYLKDIAEKGFKEAAFAEVWEYPIFLEAANFNPPLRFTLRLPQKIDATDASQFSIIDYGGSLEHRKSFDPTTRTLIFSSKPNGTGVNKYKLIYSKGFNTMVAGNEPGNPTIPRNITLGVGTRILGFSPYKFTNLSSLSYSEFKQALKYPPSKDISVFVYADPDFTNQMYNYSKVEPSPDDNVYVVKWMDYLVNEYGRYDPILILIKTW